MTTSARPAGPRPAPQSPAVRGNVNDPVLPCEWLEVAVVSDVIEEYSDIEVVAEAKEEPEPDLDVVAVVETSGPQSQSGDKVDSTANPAETAPPPEPDYDVEVECKVKDAGEPDLEVTCTIAGDSNEGEK